MASWRDAGLTGINVSVDSLDARQFHAITGQDKFNRVMAGIDAAFEAGFEKVKVNTVLMRDVNHHQLDTFLNWISIALSAAFHRTDGNGRGQRALP